MDKYIVFLATLASILVVIWFHNGNLIGGGENGLPFFSPHRQLELSKYSWVKSGLGNSFGTNVATAPTYWMFAQIKILGLPDFLIQALYTWILLVTAGISVFFLTRELFPNLGKKYYLLSSVFYWFNPFSLVNVWNRTLLVHMVFFTLLPVATLCYLKGLKTGRYYWAILTAVITGLFSYGLASIPFNMLLIFLLFSLTSFFVLTEERRRDVTVHIKLFLIFTLCFLLVNFWWISQAFSFTFSSTYSTSVSALFTSQGNIATLLALSKSLGLIINNVRLMHGTFFHDGPSWSNIYTSLPSTIFSLTIPLIILWTIWKFYRVREVLLLGILFFFTLLLTKGVNPPFGELFEFLFKRFTLFQVFRNPFEKIGILLPLFSAPLFVFGLKELNKKIKQTRENAIFIFATLLVALFGGYPFWNGQVIPKETLVPDYYSQANSWFQHQRGTFRFISLPLGGDPMMGEGMTYTWDKPYSGVELSGILFDTPNLSANTMIPLHYQVVRELARYQIDDGLFNFLPFLNAKFLMLRQDIDYKDRQLGNPRKVKENLERWIENGLISRIKSIGKLTIYEINPKLFWPKIYITPNIIASNDLDFNILMKNTHLSSENLLVLINPRDLGRISLNSPPIFIKDDRKFSQDNPSLIQSMTDEQLLSKFPEALLSQSSSLGATLKERIEDNGQEDYWSRLFYQVSIMGKRAAWVYTLKRFTQSPDLLKKTEEDYQKRLDEVSRQSLGIVDSEGVLPDVITQSLLYQSEILKRSHSPLSSKIEDLLAKLALRPRYILKSISGTIYTHNFFIPFGNNYKILPASTSATLYVDGRALDKGSSYVPVGEHELSVVDTSSDFIVVEQTDQVLLDETSNRRIPIDLPTMPADYQIEFDFKFRRNNIFDVKITQDIDKPEAPIYSSHVGGKGTNDWQHFQGSFRSSPGATSAGIEFVSTLARVCQNNLSSTCINEKLPFQAEIKNFKLIQLKNPSIRLTANFSLDGKESSTTWDWMRINPTLYKIRVRKVSNDPEVLVFSELYDSGWKLYELDPDDKWENASLVDNWRDKAREYQFLGQSNQPTLTLGRKSLEDERHFLTNNYANGWLLSKARNYNLALEFAPQRILYLGWIISGTTLLIAAIFVGRSLWWRK